jgi:hypothetical protein
LKTCSIWASAKRLYSSCAALICTLRAHMQCQAFRAFKFQQQDMTSAEFGIPDASQQPPISIRSSVQ